MSARHSSLLALTLIVITPGLGTAQSSLADLYRGGTIRLVPDFETTDADLPSGIFFVGFEQSWSISVDAAGNIYFADFDADHIKVFNPDGTFQRILGRHGAGPGEFTTPYFTTISNDHLVIWDMGNTRFCILTLDGELLHTRPLNRSVDGWPHRLQTLPDGRILMESEKRHPENPREMVLASLQLYSPTMEFLRTVHEQEARENIWLPEENDTIPRPFAPGLHWALLPDGRIALGYGEEYRIEIHDVDEGFITAFEHDRPRIRVTEADKEQWFAGMVVSQGGVVREGAPPYIVRNTEFPRFMPAFDLIIADSEGNLLIHAFREGVQEERFRYRYYDAFAPGGTFLGEVTIDGEGRFPILGAPVQDGCFYCCLTSESGEITFIRYRIGR